MSIQENNWRVQVESWPINEQLVFGLSSGWITADDLQQLVDQGADPNLRDGFPLSQIARDGNIALVAQIVASGADPKNSWALSEASRNGHYDVAVYLLDAGTSAADDNSAALFAAARAGHTRIVDLLYSLSYVDGVLEGMSFGEQECGAWPHLRYRRQVELDAAKLQSETPPAVGSWSPDPKEAEAQFDRRYAKASAQGQGIEPAKATARMRL